MHPLPSRILPAVLLFAVAFFAVAPLSASAEDAPPAALYMLFCNKWGVPLHVAVNDVWVERSNGNELSSGGKPLNPWVRAGKNRLRLRTPPDAKADSGAKIDCAVMLNHAGDMISTAGASESEGKKLATFVWPKAGASPELPIDRTLEFTVDQAPPSELWKLATPITLDGPSRTAILGLIADLHAAITKRDEQRFLALTEFIRLETARSLSRDVEKARASGPEQVRGFMKGIADAKVAPWKPEEAKVELEAGGLLAHVTVRDEPAVVIKEKDGKSFFDLRIARVKGEWVFAR